MKEKLKEICTRSGYVPTWAKRLAEEAYRAGWEERGEKDAGISDREANDAEDAKYRLSAQLIASLIRSLRMEE